MSTDYIDLNFQFETLDSYTKKMFQAENLKPDQPIDIAKAILLAEENQMQLKISTIQRLICKGMLYNLRIIRRGDELKMIIRGGETPLSPRPAANRNPMRRRQTKYQWCYATTALMLAEDTGYIKPIHAKAIKDHKSILYENDPELRYRFCGFDALQQKYFCDPGQEYTVVLFGDPPSSCVPGSVAVAATELTGRNMLSIGSGDNTYWQKFDGSLNRERVDFLARKLTVPAVLDAFIDGDPTNGKGHSFLIKDFSYDGEHLKLYTEECVYGETPVITDLTSYIDCSVWEYRIKVTNIYCFEH